MPKKTRKMKQRAAMRRSTFGVAPQESVDEVVSTSPTVAPLSARPNMFSPSTRGLSPATFDYSYIYSDLRRIALFAGFFFVVLIALAFVIK